jgi:hypothetical protein
VLLTCKMPAFLNHGMNIFVQEDMALPFSHINSLHNNNYRSGNLLKYQLVD